MNPEYRKAKKRHDYSRVVLVCILALPTANYAVDESNASQTICINQVTSEERRIELVYQTPESPIPCTLYYDKAGNRDEVASAKNSAGHCEKVERKMVRNLVKSGWDCQHSFLGSLGDENHRDVTLNLFTDTNASDADSGEQSHAVSNTELRDAGEVNTIPSSNTASAMQIASDLKARLEQSYIADLQDQLQQDFSNALGPEYQVGVTVQLALEVNITPLNSEVDNTTGELATASNSDVSSHTPYTASYALVSQAFDNEADAHRFAAEFHGIYPDVQSRVALNSEESDWRLVLGSSDNRETLDVGAAELDDATRRYFEIQETHSKTADNSQLEWVPDDWARYAVAGCYAQGHTTSLELADCAGVLLDVDSFLACLAGGICVPERFTADLSPQQIDFLEVVGSDDPVAAARGILINGIQGCENLGSPGSTEAVECVALSILDDDQRQLYDCYQRADEELDLVDCVGNETLSENVLLLERCAVDNLAMTECVMAEVNNDYLNSAARCVNYGETEAVLTCALDANIDVDESRVLSCITASSQRSDQAQCLSREYLDEEQIALLECTRGNQRYESSFGLCIANERGFLEEDEYRAAECLLAGETEPNNLLNCAGARFASNELNQCLDDNIALDDCFNTETIISEVVANEVEDLLDVEAIDNQIAMFRADLYALEGGDLSQILSNEASAEVFAATEEVAKEVRKKTGGLLKKFGFGK